MARTSRIVARGVTTLGGGYTCMGEDETGWVITLGGSIVVVNRVSCGMGGGCSGCGHTESRGIEWGSQLEKISCSLVVAVSCSWQIVERAYFTAQDRKLIAWTMQSLLLTVGWES